MAKSKTLRATESRPLIAMQAEVTISTAAAEGEEKQGPRRFDVTAYTGDAMVLAGYDLASVTSPTSQRSMASSR